MKKKKRSTLQDRMDSAGNGFTVEKGTTNSHLTKAEALKALGYEKDARKEMVRELIEELKKLEEEKDIAVKNREYELAASIRDKHRQAIEKLEDLMNPPESNA
jgi:protein-arginine kinase activator protein McsA